MKEKVLKIVFSMVVLFTLFRLFKGEPMHQSVIKALLVPILGFGTVWLYERYKNKKQES